MKGPRLAAELSPIVDPLLADGTEWDEVEVRGDVTGPQEVADVDIVGSRLVGLRLTGRELRTCG